MAERIDYLTEKDTRAVGDHLYRYWLALRETTPDDIILDVACGYGYGANMLAERIDGSEDYGHVAGFDKLDLSEVKEKHDEIYFSYSKSDLNNIILDKSADVLVCFETIEHLENPQNLISQFGKFKKVILSTPIIPTKHTNRAHLQDFTIEEVRSWFPADKWKIKWEKIQNSIYIIICAERYE